MGSEMCIRDSQGCVIPFAQGLSSGVMRPVFLPDGSMLIGQTGRGWGARGGNQAGLQRIIWDGKTIAADIKSVTGSTGGFKIHLTQPIDKAISPEQLAERFKVQSWFYTNTGRYGSPEHDRRDEAILSSVISKDRLSIELNIKDFGKGEKWTDRIYRVQIGDTNGLFGQTPSWNRLDAYFTLRSLP